MLTVLVLFKFWAGAGGDGSTPEPEPEELFPVRVVAIRYPPAGRQGARVRILA